MTRRPSLLWSLPLVLCAAGCGDDLPPEAQSESSTGADDGGGATVADTAGDDADDSSDGGTDADTFPGLSAAVEIKIDDRGVPHIYGDNDLDVMYAAGYQMATDRMFQMELMRRRATGQQAAVLGPDSVGNDELSRLMNFAGWGQANVDRLREDDPETHALIVAWLAGVNARVDAIEAGDVPLPYGFGPGQTDSMPQRWTLADHAAVAKLIFFGSTNSLERELLATIVARNFPETWEKIELSRPMYNVPTMPLDELPSATAAPVGPTPAFDPGPPVPADTETLSAGLQTLRRAMDHVPRTGSNNWAVDGRHTDNGRPIIAGDPHQPLDSPSVTYVQHLSSAHAEGTLDVMGFSFAGAAGVHMGHNRTLQWTATVNFADVMDIWEVPLSDDGTSVEVGGVDVEIVERVETIEVAGEEPQTYVVSDVPGYGVILPNDLVPLPVAAPGNALLFNWTGFAATTEERAFMRMATAASVDEYEAAVDLMTNGAFNFISADAEAISYHVRIDVPDRGSPSDRQMPFIVVDGTDPDAYWDGALPRDQVPSSRADARGWIATANNDPWGFTFDGDVHNDPWYYGYFYAAGHRAQRIDEELIRLTERGTITREDMQTLQLDAHSVMADSLLPVFAEAWAAVDTDDALESFRDRPELQTLADLLANWDRQMRRDSPEALAFHVWMHLLTEEVISDELSLLYPTILTEASAFIIKFPGLAVTGQYPASDELMQEGRDLLLMRALDRTATFLEDRYGSVDPAGYTWGDRHGTFFDNPFGEDLELGFVPTDGGEDTVNVSTSRFLAEGAAISERFESGSGAVYRLVSTFSEDGTPQAWVNFPPGNSGEPDSPHWDDTLEDWVEGTYTRLPFTAAEVDAATEATIVIEP